MILNKNKLEILNGNYLENLKFEKELAQMYGANHIKRLKLQEECNKIVKEIQNLNKHEA